MGSNCSRDANFEATLTEPKKKKPRSGDIQGKNNTEQKGAEDRQASSEKKEPPMQEGSAGNLPSQSKGRSATENGQQLGNDGPPRRSQLKMAPPERPKIKIDQNKIMANLREKKAMCNDVALIGTGGKAQQNKLGTKGATGKTVASNAASSKTGHNDKESNKNNNSKT